MRRRFIALCLGLGLLGCFAQEPVTDADKALFVRPADFAAFGIRFDDAEPLEKFSRSRQLDGSYELTHTFTTPQGAPRTLYLYTNIGISRRESDAALAEGAGKIGLLIAFRKDGVEEREVPGVQPGKLTLLVKDGRPIGNVFVLREGTKSYLFIMSGLFIQDAAHWQKLIEPKLRRLGPYAPEGKAS